MKLAVAVAAMMLSINAFAETATKDYAETIISNSQHAIGKLTVCEVFMRDHGYMVTGAKLELALLKFVNRNRAHYNYDQFIENHVKKKGMRVLIEGPQWLAKNNTPENLEVLINSCALDKGEAIRYVAELDALTIKR